MVMTIAPRSAGHSEAKHETATLVPFAIAAAVSGAVVFGVFGMLGEAVLGTGSVGMAGLAVAGGVATLYGASYLLERPLPVPSTYRQVPKLWREAFSPRTAAILYGAGLGIGFFTRVPYLTFYAALAMSLLSRDPAAAASAGMIFGLARSAPLAAFRLRDVPLGKADDLLQGVLTTYKRKIQVANGVALIGLGLVLWLLGAG